MLILCDVDQKEAFRCGNEAPSYITKIPVDPAKLSPEMRNYIADHLWSVNILGPCYDKDHRNLHALSEVSYRGFLEAIKRGMAQNGIVCHGIIETGIIEDPAVHIEPDLAFADRTVASSGPRISGVTLPSRHPKPASSRKARVKTIHLSNDGDADADEEGSSVDVAEPPYL